MISSEQTLRVIRKRLDADCLLDRQLHPSIAERLNRVRELPISNVANLHGVEVDADGVWLVWQYLDGVSLEQFLATSRSAAELEGISRELRLAVAALHSHGIVHGAIHGRNVIIDPHGVLHLTDISPLLYSDPAEDERAVAELLTRLGVSRPRSDTLVGVIRDDRGDRRLRRRNFLAAAGAIVGGILILSAILWYIRA